MSSGDLAFMNSGPLDTPPDGFPFTAESALRQLTEPAVLFEVPAMAIRAVALDPIAAAVTEHSDFLIHPWGRLLGTSGSGLTLTMEDLPAALTKAKAIFELHKTIKGEYKGVKYDANDGQLQVFVLDSIQHGIEEARRRFNGEPYDTEERTRVWDGMYSFGTFFGIPKGLIPRTTADLDEYRREMFDGGHLVQTEVSRDLLQKIFEYHNRKVPLPVARVGQAITKMSIEPEILAAAGVEITAFDRRVSNSFDRFMQHTYAHLSHEGRAEAIPRALDANRRRLHAQAAVRHWLGREAANTAA